MGDAEGGTLRRGMSVRMKRNVIACQPFKDKVSTIICSGCHALMAYPSGSEKVKCTACGTVTTGIKVPCTSCKKPLRLPIKLDEAVCPSCGYHFQPVSTFRLALPEGKEIRRIEAQAIDDGPAKHVTVTLKPTASLDVEDVADVSVLLSLARPLEANFDGWCGKFNLTRTCYFTCSFDGGEPIDVKKNPQELGITNGTRIHLAKERDAGVHGTHNFVPHQFLRPTDCAYCKKFIWGLYKQGQRCSKCRIPVHHRCSKKVTVVCEQALREACGLSLADFGDPEDSNDQTGIPEGFPIDEADMENWEEILKPVSHYHNDSYMATFGKLSDWTDEEIAEVWKKYDTDQNGFMDRAELEQFLGDLTGAEGCSFTDEEMKLEVERVLAKMDTNRNGIIEWEEFWYFQQAQRATDFLHKFNGVKLTEEKARELWEHYDEDQSGTLDTDEIKALLRDCASVGGIKISDLSDETAGFWELGEHVTWERFKTVFMPIVNESLLCTDDDFE